MQHSNRRVFWHGFLDCAPFTIIVVPYAMLFGVVARDAGLAVYEVMAMSVIVIAGASQFTAVALMQEQAPVIVILLAALAVNLRMAMYSAALAPHLGHLRLWARAVLAYMMVDQSFALSVRKYAQVPDMTPAAKAAYYFGALTAVAPLWYICTFVGAVIGQAIPPIFALEFAVPVCFIAMTAPMLHSLPHVVAAFVSVLAAMLFQWMPYNLWLIAAGLLAMMAGAQAEFHLKRKAAA
ncbi:AzlC family ABC transporter permease [Alisedimentitalea sp. MJ-SS2]|uniref:AzlC family ABC transporter permease n=1 Tax=Aliisedimentitalea sp. MJ-SS2 TaxID=3049795 RepID=UPI00291004F9|nr:AzlC family ABC transporter permease [Alisedimentitalea sp. MJ-SS2]MDU8927056.1 AzlC family ABC transporter permease [Alisedimentitalea sp. MJ-SS2]